MWKKEEVEMESRQDLSSKIISTQTLLVIITPKGRL